MPTVIPDGSAAQRGPASTGGFVVNPLAATIFLGLVLVIVIYTWLDRSDAMGRLGPFGPLIPIVMIVWLLVGVYYGVRRLKRRAVTIRLKGPLFMRSLMNGCLERTCGKLASLLEAPEISSAEILNDILQDKVLHICATDCRRFSDIRRQIESSRLKATTGLQLARLFRTTTEYDKRELPGEIRQVAETVSRSRPDLARLLERLKTAHRTLCTGTGNLLALLPPDPQKVAAVRSTYRHRPPTPERAQRMVFALETLAFLKATRHENVNPLDRKRYDVVTAEVIPKLADALQIYRRAWQDLVDAYEQPMDERAA